MFRDDYFRSLQLPAAYAKLQKISNPLYDRLTLTGPGKFTYFNTNQPPDEDGEDTGVYVIHLLR